MKKLLIGLCIFVGSVNAMDDVVKWCVKSSSKITEVAFRRVLSAQNIEVKALLAYPVPHVAGKTVEGDTWLHVFVGAENVDVVTILSEHGANWFAANDTEDTPQDLVFRLGADNEFKQAVQHLIPAQGSGTDEQDTSKPVVPETVAIEPPPLRVEPSVVTYFTWDEVWSLSDTGVHMAMIDTILRIATSEGQQLKDQIHFLNHCFEADPSNMLEWETLKNGKTIWEWLTESVDAKKIPVENLALILSIVGPDAQSADGSNPCLVRLLDIVLRGRVSEELYLGFKGKAIITNEKFLSHVKKLSNDASNSKKQGRAQRILALFAPAEVLPALEEDPGKQPQDSGSSWFKKALCLSGAVAIVYVAWSYLGYESSDGKSKGVPLK